MVFRSRSKESTSEIGKQIAKEVPGYSAEADDLHDDDEEKEVAAHRADLKDDGKATKSINLCNLLDVHVRKSKEAIKIDGGNFITYEAFKNSG